jgi:hypothetical protein
VGFGHWCPFARGFLFDKPMPRAKAKQSAHAQLDTLRQQAAGERVSQRELALRLEAAKAAVDDAGAAVTEAYAADDTKLAPRRRQEVDAAAADVLDLQHRFDAAGLWVERAQAEADSFQAEYARELLDEREPEARELAEALTRAARGGRGAGRVSTPSLARRAG